MKRLWMLMIALALPLGPLMAQEVRAVASLNQDTCWIGAQDFYEGPIKTVHFGSTEVGHLYPQHLEAVHEEIVRISEGFVADAESAKREWLFHCGSESLSIVTNIDLGESRLCAWSRFDGHNLKLQRIGVEPVAHDGHCSGAVFGQALVTLVKGVDQRDFEAELGVVLQELNIELLGLEPVVEGVFKLEFARDVYSREEGLFKLIEAHLKQKHLVRAVELNYYQHEVGDFLPMDY